MTTEIEREHIINEIATERDRQILHEGYSQDHDDTHKDGSLAAAAGAYAFAASQHFDLGDGLPMFGWPWHARHWKPSSSRQMLVKAAALIVAEIERIDREQEAMTEQRQREIWDAGFAAAVIWPVDLECSAVCDDENDLRVRDSGWRMGRAAVAATKRRGRND